MTAQSPLNTDAVSSLQIQKKQRIIKELCAATVRSLTSNATLHYRGTSLYQDTKPLALHAMHLQQHAAAIQVNDLPVLRGHIDAIALRLIHSDSAVHQSLLPLDPIARLLFEMLEQFRAESLVANTMPGMAQNLGHAFTHWSDHFYQSGLTETRLGIILYTLAQICRSKLMLLPVSAMTEDLIEATRASLAPIIGTALANLRRQRHSQSGFSQYALQIATLMAVMLNDEISAQQGLANNDDDDDDDITQKTLRAFAIIIEFDGGEENTIAKVITGESKIFASSKQGYQVFSKDYDKEVQAKDLVRKALLQEYRQKLDQQINHQAINIKRIAKQLLNVLGARKRDSWQFGLEEGYIDGRRLSQLVSSPTERRLFTLEQDKIEADCIVSFLIDCSGSMKQHTNAVTIITDVMTHALDIAGVTTEILGFTTNTWNGGRAYKDWLKQGKPTHPGRLNEVCHMIFKDANSSWRRARSNIAALLKTDLFREGIDGEAVTWACQRMQKRTERRRILIVISDGCPMDTSTNLINDTFYLDNHLKDVVNNYQQQGNVEILALGVGLDLSPYYRRNLAIDLSQQLDNQLFFDIVKLIAGK